MPYCSMIHGGLHMQFVAGSNSPVVNHCCLVKTHWPADPQTNFWKDPRFQPLRQHQDWHPDCANCQRIEQSGAPSLDRKSTRLNSSHIPLSRMPSSA